MMTYYEDNIKIHITCKEFLQTYELIHIKTLKYTHTHTFHVITIIIYNPFVIPHINHVYTSKCKPAPRKYSILQNIRHINV